jgi:hypothetical protein
MQRNRLTTSSSRKTEKMGMAVGSFDALVEATMTSASRARAKKRADSILQRMTLDQLRKDRRKTQAAIAAAMKIDQSEVSRIEKRSEVKLRTLREYVSAMGGHLELRAVFPEKNVELTFAGD